jgi:hypothetical protein
MSLYPLIMPARVLVQTLIDQAAGSVIGNAGSWIAASVAFNGNANLSRVNSPRYSAGDLWIGKDWGSGNTKTLTGYKAWGSNDHGFHETGNPSMAFRVEGSSSASFSSDVNILITDTQTDANSLALSVLTGFDTSAAYRYHRLFMPWAGGSGGDTVQVAEIQFFEDV